VMVPQTGAPPRRGEASAGALAKLSIHPTHPMLMTAEDLGAGVNRVVPHAQDHARTDGAPVQRVGRDIAYRHEKTVTAAIAGHRVPPATKPEPPEDEAARALDLLVGIPAEASGGRVPLIAGRRDEDQRPPARLAEPAPFEPQPHPVQLSFAHGPL